MARTTRPQPSPKPRGRGFEPAFALVEGQVRRVGESRGFAIARLVTHWAEVAGEGVARVSRPVRVTYGREGLGATLVLLVQGASAPMIEMQKDAIRARVNAVYGYNAIARIALTQTAASGFAEGQTPFAPAPPPAATPPDAPVSAEAATTAAGIADAGLRSALERLAQNILNRNAKKRG